MEEHHKEVRDTKKNQHRNLMSHKDNSFCICGARPYPTLLGNPQRPCCPLWRGEKRQVWKEKGWAWSGYGENHPNPVHNVLRFGEQSGSAVGTVL